MAQEKKTGEARDGVALKDQGAAGAAEGKSAEAGSAGPRTGYDWLRENLEALIVAVILAVIIRHFAVEAFEIPTGSMANTLYGIHAWLECPNCSTAFNVALQSDSSTGELAVPYRKQWVLEEECPNTACTLVLHARGPTIHQPLAGPGRPVQCGSCGTQFQGQRGNYREAPVAQVGEGKARCPLCHLIYVTVVEKKNYTGGHKILVNKFTYALGDPRRWDVIVFGFDQWKNYIKRLVGLPGETINIWDGDLYVNGAIERKAKHPYIQGVLWTKIGDTDVPERGIKPLYGNRVEAWAEIDPGKTSGRSLGVPKNTGWDPTVRRWSLNALSDAAVLEYQRGFDNYYSYNLLSAPSKSLASTPPDVQVGDKKVAFTARVAAATPGTWNGQNWVGAEIREGDFTFQLRIPVGTGGDGRQAVIERLREPNAEAGWQAMSVDGSAFIPTGSSAAIEFENADDRVAARLDGVEILALEYVSLPAGADLDHPPRAPSERQDNPHHVRLIGSGVQAQLESIRVYRDMYYIALPSAPYGRGIRLGPDQYFAMGDNAPSSSDGRYWGHVPEKNLMGKALLVFWPAWPTNFQWQFIR